MRKVTIIIPAYNAEMYIEQCARSVLNQTLKEIEIIFIDDGSTDKTGAILDRLVHEKENAIVIHQNNLGLYKSREIGLSLATGEYIGWVDADDYVEQNMFELLYNTAIDNNSELVICNYTCFPKNNSKKGKWFREYGGIVNVDFIEQNSQVWNKIVKHELLERLNTGALFESCFDEIYIRVLMEAKNPVTINKGLYHYRIGNETMSSSYKNVNHYREFVEASRKLRLLMYPIIKDEYWKDYFDYRVAYYLLMTMIVAANASDKKAYYYNRKELLSIKPSYKKNQHFWKNLIRKYGKLKAIIIGDIIPIKYEIVHLFCKVEFR